MRILLVNPPATHMISSEIPDVVREGGRLPPLGLLYLHGILVEHGHQVRLLDAGNAGLTAEDVAAQAKQWRAEAIGVTATTYQMIDARLTLRRVSETLSDILRLLGGPHVATFPDEAAWLPEVDAAFVGEADINLPDLLDQWNGSLPEQPPAGVLIARSGKLIGNRECPKPMDLDQLPVPDRSILDASLYGDATVGAGPLATVATSRGCPYNCTFCSTPGKPVRLRRPERVVDELETLSRQGYREVYFVDDTINIDPARLQAICEGIIERRLSLTWTCRMRVDRLTPELLKVLKPAGCVRVQLGVEASTDEGMQVLGKKITPDQAAQAVTQVRQVNVAAATYFMLGLPTHRTVADIRHTVDFAIKIDPDYAVFNVLVPYPGTALFDQGVKKGVLDPKPWRDFATSPQPGFHPPVWTEHLPAETLYAELRRAYRRFYLRPRTVWRQANRLTPANARAMLHRAWDVVKRQ